MTGFASKCSLVAALALLAIGADLMGASGREANATVVVFNRNDPDSKSLAQYYAGRRNIPSAQVVGLDCPASEEITRADYDVSIAGPLRSMFVKKGWWTMGRDARGERKVTATKIRFLAIMRGVPLKISPDPTIPAATFLPGLPDLIASRNDAAVDSELATLGMPVPSVSGIFPNPYFRRFTSILDNPIEPGFLLPARLDGPTTIIVRAMIDDSISAETSGLWGWGYVDARGITSGGYAEGDLWMNNLANTMRTEGIPVIFDNNPDTLPTGYPVTDAAVYFGWYAESVNGPFADPAFQFRRGAVAVHLHSFSAATLRSATAQWCGPLLAHGAAATLGNVYEPYLSLTANFDVFQDRLMSGLTLAESAYISQRALSWMGTVVGDPLYRPYAAWFSPTPDKSNPWQLYRLIVKSTAGGPLAVADRLRDAAVQSGKSLFVESLGAAQFDAGARSDALTSFQAAAKLAKDPQVQLRINLEMIGTLRALGRANEATVLANATASKMAPGPQRDLLIPFEGPVAATPTPTPIALSSPLPEITPLPTATPTATPSSTPKPRGTPLPPPPIPDLQP